MAFIFQFVNVVYYIDWFVDTEESLHPWDKAHLWSNWQTANLKNIQATPAAEFQKNKWPNQKKGAKN